MIRKTVDSLGYFGLCLAVFAGLGARIATAGDQKDVIIEYLDLQLATKECELAAAMAEVRRLRESLHLAQVELGDRTIQMLDRDAEISCLAEALAESRANSSAAIARLEGELARERTRNLALRDQVELLSGEARKSTAKEPEEATVRTMPVKGKGAEEDVDPEVFAMERSLSFLIVEEDAGKAAVDSACVVPFWPMGGCDAEGAIFLGDFLDDLVPPVEGEKSDSRKN